MFTFDNQIFKAILSKELREQLNHCTDYGELRTLLKKNGLHLRDFFFNQDTSCAAFDSETSIPA